MKAIKLTEKNIPTILKEHQPFTEEQLRNDLILADEYNFTYYVVLDIKYGPLSGGLWRYHELVVADENFDKHCRFVKSPRKRKFTKIVYK